MNRNRAVAAIVLLGLMLLSLPVMAKGPEVTWNEQNGRWSATYSLTTDIGKGGTLDLERVVGGVEVVGGEVKTAEVVIDFGMGERSSREDAEEMYEQFCPVVEEKGQTIRIRQKSRSRWVGNHNHSTHILVRVPAEFDVEGRSDGGALEVTRLVGRVDFSTGGGSISVTQHKGLVDVSSGGGGMEMRDIEGDVRMSTGGGGLELNNITGTVRGSTGGGGIQLADVTSEHGSRITTGGGSIEVDGLKGRFDVSTGGGALRGEDCAGDLTITTGGGAIRLRNMAGDLHASTGGGGIDYRIDNPDMLASSDVQLSTGHGDIDLYLPDALKATVSATIEKYRRTSDIRSDFPLETEEKFDNLYGTLVLNGGGSSISVRTAESKVSIYKR